MARVEPLNFQICLPLWISTLTSSQKPWAFPDAKATASGTTHFSPGQQAEIAIRIYRAQMHLQAAENQEVLQRLPSLEKEPAPVVGRVPGEAISVLTFHHISVPFSSCLKLPP